MSVVNAAIGMAYTANLSLTYAEKIRAKTELLSKLQRLSTPLGELIANKNYKDPNLFNSDNASSQNNSQKGA